MLACAVITVKLYVSFDNATWYDANEVTGPVALVDTTTYFKYVVSNPGEETLFSVVLTAEDGTIAPQTFGPLGPGESREFYGVPATTGLAGQYGSNATVVGYYTTANGTTLSATARDPTNCFYAAPSMCGWRGGRQRASVRSGFLCRRIVGATPFGGRWVGRVGW